MASQYKRKVPTCTDGGLPDLDIDDINEHALDASEQGRQTSKSVDSSDQGSSFEGRKRSKERNKDSSSSGATPLGALRSSPVGGALPVVRISPALVEILGAKKSRAATHRRAAGLALAARCCVDDALSEAFTPSRNDCPAKKTAHALSTPVEDGETIATFSLLVLTLVVMTGSIIWLRAVLVPFALAFFVTFLLEPLLMTIMNPASLFGYCSKSCKTRAEVADYRRKFFLSSDTPKDELASASMLSKVNWQFRAVVGVVSCLLLMLLTFAMCLAFIGKSIEGFRWQKYRDSYRMLKVVRLFGALGGDPQKMEGELDLQPVIDWVVQGPLVLFVEWTASALSLLFLMMLFLLFLLMTGVANDPHKGLFGLGFKARTSVQRYLRIKTQVSAIVAALVWFVLVLYHVDLAAVFAFLTFILNFIPHVGYTIAILTPLPLLYLDPTKSAVDIVHCILWPTIVHQVFSNVIEPRLLAKSLDLHPVVVLMSLAFWVICWGAVGAVLSTPLMCILRLIFLEIEHPYATVIVSLLEGRIPSSNDAPAVGTTSNIYSVAAKRNSCYRVDDASSASGGAIVTSTSERVVDLDSLLGGSSSAFQSSPVRSSAPSCSDSRFGQEESDFQGVVMTLWI